MRIRCRCESCGKDWYVDSGLSGENRPACPYCSRKKYRIDVCREKLTAVLLLLRAHKTVVVCSVIALTVLLALAWFATSRTPNSVNTTALTIASTQKLLIDHYRECEMEVRARNADELQNSAQKARDAIAGTVRSAEVFKGKLKELTNEAKKSCKTVSDELCKISPHQANRIRDCRRLKASGQSDLAIAMQELWLLSDKCDEAAIRVEKMIDEVVAFCKKGDSVVVRDYEGLIRLAEMTRTAVDMLDKVRLSDDVSFIKKKTTFIKSKGAKAALHEEKRIRIEALEKAREEKAKQALLKEKKR